MTFWSMLGSFFIGPLQLIFEMIFQIAFAKVGNPGVCIIVLSLAMNLLVLPLYRRADAVQEEARDREAELAPGVAHIRKTFSGNERMMMLQTYYRQNRYSPLHAFRGSVSLLLEIPFFLAAYRFLSELPLLSGVSFGPIPDLGLPDQMLVFGTLTVNLLPLLMTLLNAASAALYLRGFPLKTKIRTYAIALAFLVLLYDSPAGLVFYWTLNNLFSLGKNLVMRCLAPRLSRRKERRQAERAQKKVKQNRPKAAPEPDGRLFAAAAVFLTVLAGAFIPSVYLAASPQEYVDPSRFFHPLWFNLNALLLAAGLFLLWFGVFYRLASGRGKVVFERVLLIFALMAAVDYMFFGTRLGIISSALRYEGGVAFSQTERIVNGAVFAAVITLVILFAKKAGKILRILLPAGAAALVIMAGINTSATMRALKDVKPRAQETESCIRLSREGKNVAVLFLDRQMAEYMPYFLQEKPELKDLFDGFTWYSNVISYGGHTNMAAPALMGGYEYTPVELNRRDTEKLKDKHNEAILMMPILFRDHGFDVSVCDPPYANYSWIPDLSVFEAYPEITACITKGSFGKAAEKEEAVTGNLRNFFVFSLMKTLPLELQPGLYDGGGYLSAGGKSGSSVQLWYGQHRSSGVSRAFLDSYEVLARLKEMTSVEEGDGDHVLFFYNDAPHEPIMLRVPAYEPAVTVDNTAYDEAHTDRFTAGGVTLKMEKTTQMVHYQSDMAVLLSVGRWLEYLRAEGVYDNTRIIIVSDHGYTLGHLDERLFEAAGKTVDTESFYPLLMVKDFGASGFRISDEFMTNADVPVLAVKDLIEDPVNPFTGKAITDTEKTAHDQFIILSKAWGVSQTDRTFRASGWAVVSGDRNDRASWQFIERDVVLKEHEIPERKVKP